MFRFCIFLHFNILSLLGNLKAKLQVSVSNGKALELVSQFGIQNAWFAFLKVRGLNLSKEEAEKAAVLKHFRNKVRRLQKTADTLKDRRQELDAFMSDSFFVFLSVHSLLSEI